MPTRFMVDRMLALTDRSRRLPVDDITVLSDPANVSHVRMAGVAVKEPTPP